MDEKPDSTLGVEPSKQPNLEPAADTSSMQVAIRPEDQQLALQEPAPTPMPKAIQPEKTPINTDQNEEAKKEENKKTVAAPAPKKKPEEDKKDEKNPLLELVKDLQKMVEEINGQITDIVVAKAKKAIDDYMSKTEPTSKLEAKLGSENEKAVVPTSNPAPGNQENFSKPMDKGEQEKLANAYKTLGVDENASAQQIDKAYRNAALKTHPDKGGSGEEFSKVNEAYQTLKETDGYKSSKSQPTMSPASETTTKTEIPGVNGGVGDLDDAVKDDDQPTPEDPNPDISSEVTLG